MPSLGELITVCSDGDVVLASLCWVSEQEDLRLIQSLHFHWKQDTTNIYGEQIQGMMKRNKCYI